MKMSPICHDEDVRKLKSLAGDVLDGSYDLDSNWLSARGWTVVPMESASHFTRSDAENLSAAFKEIGCLDLFAIAAEPLKEFSNCFVLSASEEGLLEFSDLCAHFNFILMPACRSAAVLCTVEDYYLIAGPAEFVRMGVGGDTDRARRNFAEYASDPFWEGVLTRVARRYLPQRLLT